MSSAISKIIVGFIAGFLAVVIFHQGMYVLLQQTSGMTGVKLGGSPWNLAANKDAFGMPFVVNQAFWGGLWGILFAYLIDYMPGDTAWLKGFIFGCIFPMTLGSWLVVAALKHQPFFSGALVNGFDAMRLVPGFALNGVAFGIGLGIIYPLLANMMPGRAHHA